MSTTLNPEQRKALGLEPAPKIKKPGRKVPLLAAVIIGGVIMLASCGVGSAMGGTEAVPAQPTAAETVTETVTETETIEVEVTPKSCVKALHAADSGLTIAGKVGTLAGQTIDVMIEGMEAAFYQDAAGMEKVTAKIEKITGKVEANNSKLEAALADYADDSAACRAAAK